jgi:hypothetical protein
LNVKTHKETPLLEEVLPKSTPAPPIAAGKPKEQAIQTTPAAPAAPLVAEATVGSFGPTAPGKRLGLLIGAAVLGVCCLVVGLLIVMGSGGKTDKFSQVAQGKTNPEMGQGKTGLEVAKESKPVSKPATEPATEKGPAIVPDPAKGDPDLPKKEPDPPSKDADPPKKDPDPSKKDPDPPKKDPDPPKKPPELPAEGPVGEVQRYERAAPHDLVQKLAIMPDGRTLVGITLGGVLLYWDLASGKLLHNMKTGSSGGYFAAAIDPSGRRAAIGSSKGDPLKSQIDVWDLEKRKKSGRCPATKRKVRGPEWTALPFSPTANDSSRRGPLITLPCGTMTFACGTWRRVN